MFSLQRLLYVARDQHIARAANVLLVLCLAARACLAANTPEEASLAITNGDRGGSATGIDPHLAVTNAHVAVSLDRWPILSHGLTGKKWKGQVVAIDHRADVALIWVESGDLPWVPLCRSGVQAGERVRSYGYGTGRVLRTAAGTIEGITGYRAERVAQLTTGIRIEPGDSGSGIFNEAGELVAVNWGASRDTSRNAATSVKHVIELGEIWEARCGGPLCGAFGGGSQGNGAQRPDGLSPMVPVRPLVVREDAPNFPPQKPSPPKETPQEPQPTEPPANLDEIARSIADRLASDERFKGPPGDRGERGERGPPGPQGIPGPPGDRGASGTVDYDALVNRLLADPRLRSPALSVTALAESDVELLVERLKDKIEGRIHYEFIPQK